eukprot:gnl/TRDRNA2_/TRDRNA2_87372_c0_seq3.p1 gnl/TRDRNA2_/TRDRNA2_87372_c0~~gnl/TRDRNA2_/TRDRNA2_87372_c0_seq3.p1  ORF type:complete len:169 (-),score=35.99 gnl/TRDRNA2_/TRDRNA2_87372_c0_seq3:180-614(-)
MKHLVVLLSVFATCSATSQDVTVGCTEQDASCDRTPGPVQGDSLLQLPSKSAAAKTTVSEASELVSIQSQVDTKRSADEDICAQAYAAQQEYEKCDDDCHIKGGADSDENSKCEDEVCKDKQDAFKELQKKCQASDYPPNSTSF